MSNLIKPTGDMQKVIKKYGFESSAAMLKSKGFAGVLDILKKETKGNAAVMGKLFSSTEALTALLALTGDQYDAFTTKSAAMKDATGATDTAFSKLENTLKFKIDKAIVNIKNSFIKLGEKLVPTVEKIVRQVEKFTTWMANLDEKTIGVMATCVQWGIGLGVALIAIGKVCNGIAGFNRLLAGNNRYLVMATDATVKKQSALMGLLKFGLNPTTLAIVGGVGLVAALVAWNKKNKELEKGINAVEEKTKSMKKEVVSATGEITSIELNFSEGYKAELEKVTKYWEDALQKTTELPTALTTKSKEVTKANLDEVTKYHEEYNKVIQDNRSKAIAEFEKENESLRNLSQETYEAKKLDFIKSYDAAVATENATVNQIKMIHEEANIRGYYTDEDVAELTRLTEEMVQVAGSGLSQHLEDFAAFEQKKEEMWGQLTEKGRMIADKNYQNIIDDYIKEKAIRDQNQLDLDTALSQGAISHETYNTATKRLLEERMLDYAQLGLKQDEWLAHNRETYKNDENAQRWLDGVEKQLQAAKKGRGTELIQIMSKQGYTKQQIMDTMGIDDSTYTSLNSSNVAQQERNAEDSMKAMLQVSARKEQVTKELKALGLEQQLDLNKMTGAQIDDLGKLITQFQNGKLNSDELRTSIGKLTNKEITVTTNFKQNGQPAKNAKGTEYFRGGLSWVGERGPELIALPRGTKVKTARESKHIDKNSSSNPPVVSVQIDGKEIAKAIGQYLDGELGFQKKMKGWN